MFSKTPIVLFGLVAILLSSCASNSSADHVQKSKVISKNENTTQAVIPMVKLTPSTKTNSKELVTKDSQSIKEKVTDAPKEYQVSIGESMYSISRKFGISLVCLSKANGITNPNKLSAGKMLEIPTQSECR